VTTVISGQFIIQRLRLAMINQHM